MTTLRVGDPLDKNTDVGAINSQAQLERIRELVASGEEEGAEIYQPAVRAARDAATGSRRPSSRTSRRATGSRRRRSSGRCSPCSRSARPRRRVEKANNTAYGLSAGVWTEKGSRILWMAERLRAGVVWANTFNRFDPASPFGGYKESGFGREGGRHGLEPYLRFDSMSRLPVKKTYKLFIGGAFPRSESGRTFEAEGHNVARASRKDARDAVNAARGAFPAGRAATAYNRGQVLYRLAEMMEARAADLAAVCTGRTEVEAAIDRVVWYAGWADKLAQVLGSSNPVAGPYFNFTVPGADRRRRDPRTRRAAARRSRLAARARARRRQHRRRRRLRDAPGGGGRARRGDRDLRRSRRASSTSSPGSADELAPGARRSHGRERDRRDGRGRRAPPSSSALAADNVKRVVRPT